MLSDKTLAVLRGPCRYYLWNEVADVAVKAAEERAAYKALKAADLSDDEFAYPEACKRWDDAKEALDAALANLEQEASKHG